MAKSVRSLVLLAVAGCWSCSDTASLNVPTSPSATVPTETARGSGSPIVEPMRRTQEFGGGGNSCSDCLTYPGGRVHLAVSGGSLQDEYGSGTQFGGDIYAFQVSHNAHGLSLEGSGRLAGTSGLASFGVDPGGRAGVILQLSFPGGIQQASGFAVPTFRLDNDGQCPSGRRLTTTFELTLEYLGKTSVTDTHCTAT